MSLVDKLKDYVKKDKEAREKRDAIPDDQTRDHELRALRRMNRVQKEHEEKVHLKEKTENWKKEFDRKHVYGVKTNAERIAEKLKRLGTSTIKAVKGKSQVVSVKGGVAGLNDYSRGRVRTSNGRRYSRAAHPAIKYAYQQAQAAHQPSPLEASHVFFPGTSEKLNSKRKKINVLGTGGVGGFLR